MRLGFVILALFTGSLASAAAQSNDNFASRLTLSGARATAVSNNLSATRETGEPNHAANAAGRSLWWTWTAPTSGVVNFSTFSGGSGVTPPRTLAVYTGGTLSALTEAGSSNDLAVSYPQEFLQSTTQAATGTSLNLAVTAGTTYQIAVDAAASFMGIDDGTVVLSINAPPTVVSAASVNAFTGTTFQYNILASNTPTVYGATNLPAGLSINSTTGLISGVLTNDGTYSVGLSAAGPGGTGTATLTIQVGDPAPTVVLPPVLDGQAGQTGCVGTAFTYPLYATGSPASYTVANLPPGLSFSSANAQITGTPTSAGTFVVPITATNAVGTGSALVTFSIASLPLPPVFDGSLTASTTVGSSFAYYIDTTSEGPAATITGYTATGLPPGLSLGSSNEISGTATQAGVYPVAVSATNAGGTRSATVTITVSAAATTISAAAPPQLQSSAAATGTVGTAFGYVLAATNTPTSFGASNLPPGLSFDTGAGAFTGTPTTAGTFAVPVSATNTYGVSTATLTITVFASTAALNASTPTVAPVIISPVSAGGYTGQSFVYLLEANYSGELSYPEETWLFSATGLPPGLTLNPPSSNDYYGTATITGTPTTTGTYQATVSATLASSYPYLTQPATTTTAVVTFLIKPGPVVSVPIFTNSASVSMPLGTALTIYPSVTGGPTGYAASGLPPGLSVNTSNGYVSGTPTTAGTYQATLSATNSAGTGTAVVEYSVTPVTVPLVTSAATAAGVIGTAFTYTVAASPAATAFSAANLPPGLGCNTSTGVISGTPTTAGVYTVPLSVTNTVGTGSATLTFTITATSNSAVPQIEGYAAAPGTIGTSFGYYIDATNSPTGYTIGTLPPGLTADTSGDIQGTPTTAGTYSVPISATNAAGTGHATVTFIIAALPVPVLSSSAVVDATVNTSFSYYVSASNSPTSYAASGLPSGVTFNTSSGYLSGTLATAGSYPVTISASNASGAGSATLTINVVPVAAPVLPVVGGAAGATVVVGNAFSYAVQASGTPTGYGVSSVPAGLSFNSSTGVLSGTPTVAGTYPLTFSAANATGTGRGVLNLVVSSTATSAPAITGAAQLLVWQKQPFSYSIANGPTATSYTAGSLPNGATLNASTGVISGTLATTGTYTVPIAATNSVGTTSATLTITVVASTVAVATNPAEVSALVGQTFSTTLTASGSSVYSNSASPLPAGLSLNGSTGVITGTPSSVGTTLATTSQYTNLGYANARLLFAVSSSAPTVPVVSSVAGAGAYAGFPLTYLLQATNSPTAFAATGLPAGVTLNSSTGLISGTPNGTGTFPVTVSATNAKGTSGAAVITFTVTNPPNSLLQVTSAASTAGVVGAALSYATAVSTYYPYGNEFYASNLPPGLGINVNTGVISGAPTTSGVYATTLTVEGPYGYSTPVVVTFNIAATPTTVPVLTSPAGASGIVGTGFSYTVAASNAVTLGVSSLPGGLSFYAATGVISGTPTASGTFSIPLTATNSLGQGSATLTLAVAANAPAPPTLTTSNPLVYSYTLGSAASTSIYASNNPITYAASNLPPGLSVNAATGVISGTLTTAGVYPVTISAANGAGSVSAVITYVVAPVTAVPVFNDLAAEAVGYTGLGFGTVYLEASGSPTTYAASGLPPGLILNAASGTVAGTPTAAGSYLVNVSATNAAGTGSAVWTVVVYDTSTFQPAFYSTAAAATATVGQAFSDDCEVNTVGAGTSVTETLSFTYSGLPPGVTGNASNSYYAYLSGTPTTTGVYPVTVTATTPGGVASSEVVTLVIGSVPPAVTSAAAAAGNVGSAFSYVLASASTVSAYAASGLPPGLTLNASTGAITGTPTAAGAYAVPVSATGIAGTGSAVVTFQIGGPAFGGLPVINSAAQASDQDIESSPYGYSPYYGYNPAAFSYTITAINLPTSFGASNLPAGLSLNPYTGVISGLPLVGGAFQVPITATNAAGTCSAVLTILTTATPPAVFSPLVVNGVVGTAFSDRIETPATEYGDLFYEEYYGSSLDPLSFAAVGLPPGLSLNTITGAITGTPTLTGTFPVAVSATNRAGTDNAVLTIVITSIAPPPNSLPIFEGEDMAAGFVGSPLNYSLFGYYAASYTATGLPGGLSFNSATGAITGTPTQAGTFSVPVSATNAVGTVQAVLTIAVDAVPPTPYIYSAADASATVGTPFVYAIAGTSSGGPAITTYGASNLPAGLNFNPQTGFITGTPTGPAGTFQVPVSSSIGAVVGNATLTLIIQAASASSIQPVLVAPAGALGFLDNPFSYGLATTGFAPASALPAGLSFDPASGAITGYPTTVGTYQISLATSGASGSGSAVRKTRKLPSKTRHSLLASTTSNASMAVLTLSVSAPDFSLPRLTGQPTGATVLQNGSVTFVATAVGAPSPTYQWAHNGMPLAGATAATLTLADVQPADAGTYTLTAANVAGQTASLPAVLTVQQTYATWQAAHFTTAEINAGLAANGVDLTGDGVPNLLKYALGIDPITGLGGSLPTGVYSTANGALQLAFTRDTGRTDINYIVEASPDLSQWTAIASSTSGLPTANLGGASTIIENGVPGTSQVNVVVQDGPSGGAVTRQFLRLKVVRP